MYQNLNELLPNPTIILPAQNPKQHNVQAWFKFLFDFLNLNQSKLKSSRSELTGMYNSSYYQNLLQNSLLLELPKIGQSSPHLTLGNSNNPLFSKNINLKTFLMVVGLIK